MSRGTVTVSVTYDRDDMAMRGRIGAAVTHSRHDPRTATEAARAALWAKWERQVDPDGILAPEERRRRAEHAQRAHLLRASRASAVARRKARSSVDALTDSTAEISDRQPAGGVS
jgi:hypothetical protein